MHEDGDRCAPASVAPAYKVQRRKANFPFRLLSVDENFYEVPHCKLGVLLWAILADRRRNENFTSSMRAALQILGCIVETNRAPHETEWNRIAS